MVLFYLNSNTSTTSSVDTVLLVPVYLIPLPVSDIAASIMVVPP